jgi:hypothetical protein
LPDRLRGRSVSARTGLERTGTTSSAKGIHGYREDFDLLVLRSCAVRCRHDAVRSVLLLLGRR